MNNGFITIHRKITEWEWYTDGNTLRLFMHLLLNANHKPKRWKGVEVNRGQLITGRKTLAEELRLSEQQIRTSINKLKSTNEITTQPTNKFTLVTIVNYDNYQSKEKEATNKPTNKLTDEQPTSNHKQQCNKETIKDIYAYYLTKKNLIKHKRINDDMIKAINKACKELGLDAEYCKRIIDRHSEKVEATKNNGKYKVKKRELAVLFGQKKSNSVVLICSDYLDENYELTNTATSNNPMVGTSTETEYRL